MANFTFQRQRPNPEALAGISQLFGKTTHTYTPTRFLFQYADGKNGYREERRYRVRGFTSNTVSIEFLDRDLQREMTLYRGDGLYFVRSQDNLEYFKKLA